MATGHRPVNLAKDGTDIYDCSRATSPGVDWEEVNGMNGDSKTETRTRPRIYPYFQYLPYKVETQNERLANLNEILKHLYVAIEAGDFAPGAVHWTRELRNWLQLKFDPPKSTRVKLAKLYYELSLAPGIEHAVADRLASMFMVLTK